MASPIPSFLSKFSTDRKFAIPLPFQWTISIEDAGIAGAIKASLAKIDLGSWVVSESTTWTDENILVAQEVTLPGEMYDHAVMGHESSGPFMPGYGVIKRADFTSRNVVVNFLETERDIATELFRPWIIALSVDGLINSKLKAKAMDVVQYSRDMKIRKRYKFTNIFPVNCEGHTLTYGDGEFTITSVSFGFTKYEVTSSPPK